MRFSTSVRVSVLTIALAGMAFPQKTPAKRPAARSPQKAAPASTPPASTQCPIPRDENQQIYRLMMKDGSYQPITKCELADRGARVHYWSAERSDWEDVPNSLVDWAATEKFAKEGPQEKPAVEAADVAAVDAEEEAERKAEESKSPEVEPGLRLPEQGGVFVLDY